VAAKNHDIKARLLATFQVEAQEHLEAITTNLLALDRGLSRAKTREVVEVTFREVHTLKGAARSVNLADVEALCQALESVLSRITRGQHALTPPILRVVQEAVDGVARLLAGGEDRSTVNALIARLEQATARPAAEAAEPGEAPVPRGDARAEPAALRPLATDTIRLATAKLDAVLLQAEDLLVPKLAAAERVREVNALAETLTRCQATFKRLRAAPPMSRADGSSADRVAALDSEFRAAQAQTRALLGRLVHDHRTISGTVGGLLEEIRRMRMMPASTVLDLFPRMVWDLAAEQGKEVEWVVRGADLEVDRKVLEVMKDPLIHLVRNAVDHGIEPPEERARAGKPTRGRVAVTVASQEGNRIEIRVEDDGRGIDLARVREAAVRAKLLTSEAAEAISDEDAVNLVYHSGLSTSPIITDLSGHGLGLAIVKERVERLGGRIRLERQAGTGLAVHMTLPASIATFQGLLVRAGGQPFLLPAEAVERVIRIAPETVQHVEGREATQWEGQPLPVAGLSGLLGLPSGEQPSAFSRQPEAESGRRATNDAKLACVIVRSGEERAGVFVEEVLGDQEVLVKELRPPLVRVRNIAGAGLLGTGQVALILRPADLLKSMKTVARPAAPPAATEGAARQPAVLVVDDSITTRTMEKNLLEAAGYQVKVAVDGIDAWTLLKSEEFDLVVSDVDMPRMDGLDLTAKIRADQKLGDLPVVLVTALESREDKERGIEVGANAYIVKSSFDQSNLLEIIRRLI
jgi:two-component system chemotaxis sensor kinase CheA